MFIINYILHLDAPGPKNINSLKSDISRSQHRFFGVECNYKAWRQFLLFRFSLIKIFSFSKYLFKSIGRQFLKIPQYRKFEN